MRRAKVPEGVSVVVGLDLSLRASGACAIPLDWGHDVDRVRCQVFGEPLSSDATHHERLVRMSTISAGVLQFLREAVAENGGAGHRPAVFVEEMAFGQMAAHAREVAELTGIVKWRIREAWGVGPEPIVASRARKILLQKLPRKDVKKFVVANARRLGDNAAGWSDWAVDSFVVANAGLERVGCTAMTFLGE